MSAYTRVTLRPGVVVNRRTAAMLAEVERRIGKKLVVIQGSYNPGKVSASAGVHDGGGAVDVWLPGVAIKDVNELVVRPMRKVGFAAWYRAPLPNVWGAHVHAVAIGDEEMSPQARGQITQYKAGLNGLANHGRDDGPRVASWHLWKTVLLRRRVKAAQKDLDAWIAAHS